MKQPRQLNPALPLSELFVLSVFRVAIALRRPTVGRQRRKTLTDCSHVPEDDFTVEELEQEHAHELPQRDLLLGVSLLGIPLVQVTGLNINIS